MTAQRRVSVRIVAEGGKEFKATMTEIGAASERSFNMLNRSAQGGAGGLQNLGFQVQDFAVQVGAGTSATQALAQQLPQLLSGFGGIGIAVGTASAVLIPLIGQLFQTGEATENWIGSLDDAAGSVSGVESAVSALNAVQEQYNAAIAAQGGASSAAASLVISNSAREFAARKSLLDLELQLLRARAIDGSAQLANSEAALARRRDAALEADPRNQLFQSGRLGQERAQLEGIVNTRAGEMVTQETIDAFRDDTLQTRQEIQKARAELELMNITVAQSEELLDSTFETIAGGGGAVAAPSGGGGRRGRGGGGGGGAPRAVAELTTLRESTQEVAQGMKSLESAAGQAFVSFVTGAKSGEEALGGLLKSLAETLANSAFQQIAGSIFGGGGGGLFSGIFGGGRAGGGSVLAGRSYMVGENGPELVTMGGNGYVTNTAALRSAVGGGGGVTISVDARGAVEGTDVLIARRLREIAPQIVQASVAASRQAAARGR